MSHPTLHDDGGEVTLDLHGATVDEALALSRTAIRLASQRGRAAVKLIHGSSTSSDLYRNRTIKHALYDALERGRFDEYMTDAWRRQNVLHLSLDLAAPVDPTPLRLLDLTS